MIEKICELTAGEYICDIDITRQEWKDLLKNPQVFDARSLEAIEKWYREPGYSATCYDIGEKYHQHSMSANGVVNGLGGRVQKHLGRFMVKGVGKIAKGTRFITVMESRETQTLPKRFLWTLRRELVEAIEELEIFGQDDCYSDETLLGGIEKMPVPVNQVVTYEGNPRPRRAPVIQNSKQVYPRNKRVSLRALIKSGHRCECGDHELFKRRASEINYTEPHHLIPMSKQDLFGYSLDIEENIVSLCCHCHKKIHLGAGHDEMLQQLFEQRKDLLSRAGLDVSFEDLLSFY